MAEVPLEPLAALEAREFLSQRGVTNERVIAVILELSGRLPIWLDSLAANRPDNPKLVGDPTGHAVERFLRWNAIPSAARWR
jgi:hypothetical protein